MKRIVSVCFSDRGTLSEKSYAYFTDIEDLKTADWVIVVVNLEPKTAMVTDLNPSPSDRAKASKWIVSRVDLLEYEIRMKKQTLISEIENELDEQLKKVQRYEMFKACAQTSSVMKDLLKKLQDLDPSINLIEDSNPSNTKE